MDEKGQLNKHGFFLAAKYLLAVIVVIGAVFFLVPYLIELIPNGVLLGISIILLAPLLRAISELLLDERWSHRPVRAFVRIYLLTLFSLIFELTTLLLALPFIALRLAALLTGMMLLVMLVGLFIYTAQTWMGLSIGRPLDATDLQLLIRWLGYGVLAEGLWLALIWLEKRYQRPLLEAATSLYRRSRERIAGEGEEQAFHP